MITNNPTEELIQQLDSVRRFNSEQLELYNKVVAQRDMLYGILKGIYDYYIEPDLCKIPVSTRHKIEDALKGCEVK